MSDAKATYKWLKGGVEFIDEVPKNPTGKIVCYILAFSAFRSLRKFLFSAPSVFARQGESSQADATSESQVVEYLCQKFSKNLLLVLL